MNVCSEELSAVVLGVSEGQVVVLFEEEYCQYCFYWKFFFGFWQVLQFSF